MSASMYAPLGIRINVVAPGFTQTAMIGNEVESAFFGTADQRVRWWEAHVASMERVAQPWEIAGPITFLSCDQSSFMTGSVLTVDGGASDNMWSPFWAVQQTAATNPFTGPDASRLAIETPAHARVPLIGANSAVILLLAAGFAGGIVMAHIRHGRTTTSTVLA